MSVTTTQIRTGTHTILTSDPPSTSPDPVYANFNYYLPPNNESEVEPSADDRANLALILGNANADTRRLPLHDLRGQEGQFTLNKNGFCVVKLDSIEKTFEDDERIKEVYYPEMEKLVKEQL